MKNSTTVWQCDGCPVRKLTIVSDLKGDDLLEFQQNVQKNTMSSGQLIFSEGDSCRALYIIMHGNVKLYYESIDGKKQIVDIIGPGAIFGALSLNDINKCDVSAEAYGDGIYCSIPLEYYYKLVQSKPQVALRLLTTLESQLTKSRKTIRDLSLKRAKQRVASIIIRLASEDAVKTEDGMCINLPVTVQTLAYMSGLTQETTSRVISEFRKDGLVILKRKRLTIKNILMLDEVSNAGN